MNHAIGYNIQQQGTIARFMNGNGNYLPRKTFFWFAGVMITVMIAMSGYIVGRVDTIQEKTGQATTEIKVDVSSIKTDLGLLREDVRDIKNKL